MTKLYPKGTIRRIIKAHEPQHKLSKSADVLVNSLFGLLLMTGLLGLRLIHERIDEGGRYICATNGRHKDQRSTCKSKHWRITPSL